MKPDIVLAHQSGAFGRAAHGAARLAGRPWAFVAAIGSIVAWLISGPMFGFSDTWQLVINTATTVITFLMVFLIQNSQNRDTAAIQIKLDELIRAVHGAQNALFDLEELDDAELERIRAHYAAMARQARSGLEQKAPLDEDPPSMPSARGRGATKK